MESLKKEWGAGFDNQLSKAKEALTLIGDKDLISWLDETKLNSEPKMIKTFAKLAELLGEDKVRGETKGGMTPNESKAELNSIMADKKGPYFDKYHPGHKDAVAHVQKLFTQLG
jgi:hypothetical protein